MEYKIYKITNLVNNKLYIGITKTSLRARFQKHLSDSFRKKMVVGFSINKHGKENFKIELLDTAPDLDSALILETKYIKLFDTLAKNGKGYNVIENTVGGEQTPETKLKLVATRKKNKIISGKTPYIGVHFLEERKRWSFSIQFEKISVRHKNFGTDKDAAIARDIALIKNFEKDRAMQMMNFPENYDKYYSEEIISPEKVSKICLKNSKYKWVNYEAKSNQWRARVKNPLNKKFESLGMYRTESEAAEAADYLSIKFNNKKFPLNFPEKESNYSKSSYLPPQTIAQTNRRGEHKNISLEGGRYRVKIKNYRLSCKTIEEAIKKRNEILLSIGHKIPD